jgi:glycosyltransferase involved in cell wall biosynthesis
MLSVVVAALNEEQFLARCLRALYSQAYSGTYEVIVVDNGSVDNTVGVAKNFPCKVIREERKGQVHAKHRGCMAARGELIAVLDADCVPNPSWLATIEGAFARISDLVAITATYKIKEPLPRWARLYWNYVHLSCIALTKTFPNLFPYVIGGNVAFRSSVFRAIGGYEQRGAVSEVERGLAKKLLRRGNILYLDELIVESSARRFKNGMWSFFYKHKLREYWLPG